LLRFPSPVPPLIVKLVISADPAVDAETVAVSVVVSSAGTPIDSKSILASEVVSVTFTVVVDLIDKIFFQKCSLHHQDLSPLIHKSICYLHLLA